VDILARYGGDEFIILLPETNTEQALEIAERLRDFMENNPIKIGNANIRTTLSIGVAGTKGGATELDVLLKCADTELYEAKQSGRNCVKVKTCPTLREKATTEKLYD
jgi:diguanylate cyclase (GGDEF)-like protein